MRDYATNRPRKAPLTARNLFANEPSNPVKTQGTIRAKPFCGILRTVKESVFIQKGDAMHRLPHQGQCEIEHQESLSLSISRARS